MKTPAQKRREFIAAKNSGLKSQPALSRHANAYELMLARLDADRRRLKLLQSLERKVAAKRDMLPDYAPWIDGSLTADRGGQDDVVTTVMVWRIDTGDYAGALDIAAYVIRHGLTLPDHYKRTAGCLVAEEIAEAALVNFSAGKDFDLAVLTRTIEITQASDMPDEVRAKLIKAEGLAQEATGRLERALASYQHALTRHAKVGVKKDIERVRRAIKNLAEQGSEVRDQRSGIRDQNREVDPGSLTPDT